METQDPEFRTVFSLKTLFVLVAIAAAYFAGASQGNHYANGASHARARAIADARQVECQLRECERKLHELEKGLGRNPSPKYPGLAESSLARYLNPEQSAKKSSN